MDPERALAEALAIVARLRGREARDRHRALLGLAIAGAREVGAQALLARAQLARAEDALHGASQLSQSAQRAPTVAACDDGWRRVAELVAVAVEAAAAAGPAGERVAAAARDLLAAR